MLAPAETRANLPPGRSLGGASGQAAHVLVDLTIVDPPAMEARVSVVMHSRSPGRSSPRDPLAVTSVTTGGRTCRAHGRRGTSWPTGCAAGRRQLAAPAGGRAGTPRGRGVWFSPARCAGEWRGPAVATSTIWCSCSDPTVPRDGCMRGTRLGGPTGRAHRRAPSSASPNRDRPRGASSIWASKPYRVTCPQRGEATRSAPPTGGRRQRRDATCSSSGRSRRARAWTRWPMRSRGCGRRATPRRWCSPGARAGAPRRRCGG